MDAPLELVDGRWEVVRWGVSRWVPNTPPPPPPVPKPVNLCGTDAGYYRHRRRRQKQCEPCLEAHAVAVALRAGTGHTGHRRRLVAVCGTESGRKKHVREGTPICADCKTAHAQATNQRRINAKNRRQAQIRRAA